jgi:hypothetical protein
MAITVLFAGVGTADYDSALPWYERLLGCPPDLIPHETEAAWQLAEAGWMYLVADPDRAGEALLTTSALVNSIRASGTTGSCRCVKTQHGMSYGHFHSAGSFSANSWPRIHSYVKPTLLLTRGSVEVRRAPGIRQSPGRRSPEARRSHRPMSSRIGASLYRQPATHEEEPMPITTPRKPFVR